ncbi:hypothetical protein ACJMK2_015664 [Sinanodonta woodiana]|uniref:Uncharacterized protein n=1 Tax=Sinanodonta woodiana TaxID=1069815 RepID=A0ABD3UR37_SINWO
MKTALIVLCCLIYVLAQDQICHRDTDCPTDQCCVHSPFSRTRGARFLLGDFFQHDHGYCRHYRTLNETCNVLGHDFLNAELHEFFCGCEKGLECRGERVHESTGSIIHENPKCQETES